MIQARPTFYSGIKFRSRLEATWACFFDLCGWTWVYEPMDLKGWVPDFELHTQNGRRLLVEVKPENFNCFNAYSVEESVYSKAVNHVEHYDLMLLGVSPFRKDNYHCIGILVYMEDSVQNGKELMIDYAGFKLDGRGYG